MEIEVTRACVYEDGRCHACFTDGSAVIMHPGGQFTTSFSPSGEIQRQVTSCVVGVGKLKLLKAIQLYNSLSHSPLSVFCEEIYDVMSNEDKISNINWINPGYLSVVDKQSNEEVGGVEVDNSSEAVGVVYRDSMGALTMKSINGEVTMTLNPLGNLFKVSFPFLLPHRKPSWTTQTHNRIRLSYEYVELDQIFTTRNYPPWCCGPLQVLLFVFRCEKEVPQELVLHEVSFIWDHSEMTTTLPTTLPGEIWKGDMNPSTCLFNYFESKVSVY